MSHDSDDFVYELHGKGVVFPLMAGSSIVDLLHLAVHIASRYLLVLARSGLPACMALVWVVAGTALHTRRAMIVSRHGEEG